MRENKYKHSIKVSQVLGILLQNPEFSKFIILKKIRFYAKILAKIDKQLFGKGKSYREYFKKLRDSFNEDNKGGIFIRNRQ